MARDLRMSRMLHVLIHLDRHVGRATSEQIAQMISTNAVVVRRMMAGLRERGIVSSEKGHGGGWQLVCPLAEISLRDVYEAVGHPPLFNIGPQADRSSCLVEQAVDARLDATLAEAEARLLTQFAEITVEEVAQDFEHRFDESGHTVPFPWHGATGE
ncbi:MAG: transcriptional regulator [Yangia sp.]|nr:transcriptional regulator [Salipiger sp.]